MIKKSDYLKSFKRMNEDEKLEYLADVDKWCEDVYPRLAALDDSYDAEAMKDFDEGLKLATALQKAQGFVSAAYRYDATTRLNRLRKVLDEVRIKSGMNRIASRPANDKKHYMAVVPPQPKLDENGIAKPVKVSKEPEVDGRRPEHLSQYLHLLPEDLRKESADLQSLYDQLRHWRGRAEFLSIDPRSNKAMISNCAKKVVKLEGRILNFWQRVDLAYSKATGKPVDVDLEEDLAKEAKELNKPEIKSAGEYTKAEIDLMDDAEMKENCTRARKEANKKFIRRDDTQMTEERKEQFKLRITELMEWGLNISDKAAAICQKYNIVVPGYNDNVPAEEPAAEAPVAEPTLDLFVETPENPEPSENSETSEEEINL